MFKKKLYLIERSFYTGRPIKIQWLDKERCLNVLYCNVLAVDDDNFEVVYLNYTFEKGWKALTETISFSDVVKVTL